MSNQITGEKKRKINLIDFFLIILIIVVIAAAVVTVVKANPENSASGDKIVTYTISVRLISPEIAAQLKAGDTIYDNATAQNLGTVQSIEIIPLTASMGDTEVSISDKVDLRITVRSSVYEDESSYTIGNYRLSSGSDMAFHSVSYMLSGKCLSINSNYEV